MEESVKENIVNIESAVEKIFKNVKKNYIFVYTPPKVGSTTLVSSLRIALSNIYNVIHIHDEIMLKVLSGVENVTINEIIDYLAYTGKKVFIIDVYRTPLERKMSEFIEKISPYHFNNSIENINKYPIGKIIKRFNDVYRYLGKGDHYNEVYNINDTSPFNFEKKYKIHKVNTKTYLKLRLSDSGEWSQILSEVFGKEVIVVSDYLTKNKSASMGELYKRFKKEYRLPLEYYEEIKDCKYFNMYNTKSEREIYLKNLKTIKTEEKIGYTQMEYDFYIHLCMENQVYNDIDINHYIDNGCTCKNCNIQRRVIFNKLKKNEPIVKGIIHVSAVKKNVFQLPRRNTIVMM